LDFSFVTRAIQIVNMGFPRVANNSETDMWQKIGSQFDLPIPN